MREMTSYYKRLQVRMYTSSCDYYNKKFEKVKTWVEIVKFRQYFVVDHIVET